jgi:glutamate N-acetyltransferase / amino-acid N-acetyltransferase
MDDLILARGYRFAGVHCGIKPDPSKLDLGLVVSDVPAVAAGVFTQNRVTAAPVKLSRQRVPTANARGVVICSGNANACTGEQGLQDGQRMTEIAAKAIGCQAEQMLVCSTGVIGRPLPMDKIEPGIRSAACQLADHREAFHNLAQAILTTDTKIKVSSRSISISSQETRLTGFAKGAAMIGPNMATLLAFVLTDAAVAPDDLADIARRAAASTFNCISVEGHTSTNDTLLFFANGQALSQTPSPPSPLPRSGGEGRKSDSAPHLGGGSMSEPDPSLRKEGLIVFERAATEVCAELARAIAADAEGAAHFVTIEVEGLRTDAEAKQIAKTIADSALVKTAIFGGDPNWGRFMSAAGYAGVVFDESDLSLWLGQTLLYKAGTPQDFDSAAACAYLKNNREVTLRLKLNLGVGRCTFWTCDLGYDYVRLNAEYTT